MPPQSQIAASGLVMFSGFYPPAMQVFTLSCIRHRRGFFIIVWLNSTSPGGVFRGNLSLCPNLAFCHTAAEKASVMQLFSRKTLTKSVKYIQYKYILIYNGVRVCVLFQVQQGAGN